MARAGEDQPKRQQGRTRKRTHKAVGHLPELASSRSSKRRRKHQQDPSSAAQPQQQPSNQASSSSGFPPELVTCACARDSETSFAIPVVDFGVCSLSEKDVSDEQLQSLSKEFKSAFTEVGFVFLKNTGITQQEVDDVMDISKKFFLQPDELKQPFSRNSFSEQSKPRLGVTGNGEVESTSTWRRKRSLSTLPC